MSRPAVFLDRDGTLIEEVSYLDRLERVVFYPFSVDAVRLLNQAGFVVVVATNQSGVARGLLDEGFIAQAHAAISERMHEGGARIDAYYYCPHHPEAGRPPYRAACECRKPAPGMLRRAAADLDLDLARSVSIGDRLQDLEAGRAAGGRGVLVRTGYGRRTEAEFPDALREATVTDNLAAAVGWLLRQRGGR
jgi:D-glycero-D-manno-heptose 1,7-bisphosphate phosphatase